MVLYEGHKNIYFRKIFSGEKFNMTDIKKTDFSPSFSSQEKPKSAPQPITEKAEEVALQNTDLRNDPTAYLGRSQVKKSEKISASNEELRINLEKDLEFLAKNPQTVERSNQVFEGAFKNAQKASNSDPYKHASQVQDAFLNEFTS